MTDCGVGALGCKALADAQAKQAAAEEAAAASQQALRACEAELNAAGQVAEAALENPAIWEGGSAGSGQEALALEYVALRRAGHLLAAAGAERGDG